MADPNYVVGRGKLFFNQFLPDTRTIGAGSRYLGNSPELSLSQSEEKLDHYSSDQGLRVKDASVSLQNDMSGSFTLDDISQENLALWFRGSILNTAVAGGAVVAESHEGVVLGTHIQLGRTAADPIGARNVSAVVVKVGATTIAQPGNYEVDAATGRIFLLSTSPDISDEDDLLIDYTAAAGTESVVISAGTTIEGMLEFVADNAAGANDDYIWPYVQISPDGDLALKGDDWMTMSFTLEVLKLNDSTERQYIVRRTAA